MRSRGKGDSIPLRAFQDAPLCGRGHSLDNVLALGIAGALVGLGIVGSLAASRPIPLRGLFFCAAILSRNIEASGTISSRRPRRGGASI